MKQLLKTLLLVFAASTAIAQQKPVYERTKTGQVLSDYATWSKYFLAIPSGTSPAVPSYVPDSLKKAWLYYKISPGDTALFIGGKRVSGDTTSLSNRINRKLNLADTMSMLATYATLNRANTFTNTNIFSKDLTVNGHTFGRGGGGIITNLAGGKGTLGANIDGEKLAGFGDSVMVFAQHAYQIAAFGYGSAMHVGGTAHDDNVSGPFAGKWMSTSVGSNLHGKATGISITKGNLNDISGMNGAYNLTTAVTGITGLVGGSGYTAPVILIDTPMIDGVPTEGRRAKATATVVGGVITAITMTDEGSIYSDLPVFHVSDPTGTGASMTAVLTSGERNTSKGSYGMYNTTTASDITNDGYAGIFNNKKGHDLAGVGKYNLYDSVDGSWLAAMGPEAGKGTGGVLLQHMNNGMYIGPKARASVDALTDFAAIGYDAIATASHQMRFGSTTITSNVFSGNINTPGSLSLGLASTTPIGMLTMEANSAVDLFQIRHSNNATPPTHYFQKSRGTITTPLIVSASDNIANFGFQAHDGTGMKDAAMIKVLVDGTPGAGSMPGMVSFWTTPTGSTTLVERFRIDATGLGKFFGNLSAVLPAYSSGTYLPAIYNSTTNKFETKLLSLTSDVTGILPIGNLDSASNVVSKSFALRYAKLNNAASFSSLTTPIFNSTAIQTTITGTASGTGIASMPFQGASYKKVIIYLNNLSTTTQTYTFPAAFINYPVLTSGITSGSPFVTYDGTHIDIQVTGTAANGWLILEGY